MCFTSEMCACDRGQIHCRLRWTYVLSYRRPLCETIWRCRATEHVCGRRWDVHFLLDRVQLLIASARASDQEIGTEHARSQPVESVDCSRANLTPDQLCSAAARQAMHATCCRSRACFYACLPLQPAPKASQARTDEAAGHAAHRATHVPLSWSWPASRAQSASTCLCTCRHCLEYPNSTDTRVSS